MCLYLIIGRVGTAVYIPGEKLSRRTARYSDAKAWMEHFFNKIGDKMSHMYRTDTSAKLPLKTGSVSIHG